MASAGETLGRFVASLSLDRVPGELVRKIKLHLLDTLGVACSGHADPDCRKVASVVRRWGGAAEAGVIGSALRLPAPKAAFLNALQTRVHTFDDTHEAGPAHPGAAVVASALAAAERGHGSGPALLAALIGGYEVATRVAAALGAGHYGSGFHSTGTSAPFGAAAAACRVLNLDATASAGALGLAGEAAIGLRQYQLDGSMLDTALNGARGAELGLAAAELAAVGLSGPHAILDGAWGVLKVMNGSEPERLTQGLGERWELADTSLKPFASCRFTHGPVQAIRQARIDAEAVQAVEIATFRESVEVSDRPLLRNRAEAILSHQAAAAMAFLGLPMLPADFETVGAPVRELAKRIRVRHDPALDRDYPETWPHRITVTLRAGGAVTLKSDHPPQADAELTRSKFRALAAPVLGAEAADQVIALVDGLESLSNLRPLMAPMQPADRIQ
jgi:2-methylcitrate dehydratase PrpD